MAYANAKSTLISLTVIMALTSCGKSKELKTPAAPAPTLTTPATPTAETPQPLTEANPIPDNHGMLPADNSNGFDNQVLPPLPSGPAKGSQTENSNVLNPPLAEVAKPNPQLNSTEAQKAYQIDFTNQDAVKTGGRSKDLFYTSAGSEGLMGEFKSYAAKVSADQQRMNLNLAKGVVTAKISKSNSSGDVMLDLLIDESLNATGAVKVYRLKATADGSMRKLTLVSNGGGALEFQGGFLKCIDADGGCETAYTKIKLSGAYTRIIFRNSLAEMHFGVQQNIINNSGFDLMKKYIFNTAQAIRTTEKLQALQISSFEVTNGRAGLGALLTTEDKEMIGFSIPLVVSAIKSEVNAPIAKLSDLSKNYDLSALANSYSQKLGQEISDVRLVNNNGLGQIKIKMTLGQGSQSGSIWMTAAKVNKPVMSMDQIRQFELKLKTF